MIEYLKKNYLRSCRMRLGLTQQDLAFIICLDGSARISALENGHTMPTAAECVVFQKLFERSLHELWPHWAAEIERDTDLRLLHLIDLLTESSYSPAKQRRVEYTHRALRARITPAPEV